jgi:hypothetical protein
MWAVRNVALVIVMSGLAAAQNASSADPVFPETNALMANVARHQKDIEEQINLYTFTDTTTISDLDKAGKVQKQHVDVYYVTPTQYEIFALHVRHDGKATSDADLQKQQNAIAKKLEAYERKAEKEGDAHPKDTLLFADIVRKSQFTPLRWEEMNGHRVVVYAFEAKEAPASHGDLIQRIAGDMKGKMWISPEDEQILRVEFSSVVPLSLGMGVLGNVKGFDGYVEQRKVHGEIWLPSHQEFVATGRQFVSGFRIRQATDYSEFLKASTDVFQQIHTSKNPSNNLIQPAAQNDAASQPASGSHE